MHDWWSKYIGINFKEKGRSLDGLDCWGLVRLVYNLDRDIELPSYLDQYNTTNDRDALAELITAEKESKWQSVDQPQEFDVIILRMRGVPMHVGLVTYGKNMIHSARGVGVSHEPFNNLRWKDKVLGYARYSK